MTKTVGLIFFLQKGFEALQPDLGFLASYGSGLSFYDIADITDAYKCTGNSRSYISRGYIFVCSFEYTTE